MLNNQACKLGTSLPVTVSGLKENQPKSMPPRMNAKVMQGWAMKHDV
jgi:hypothetical protein